MSKKSKHIGGLQLPLFEAPSTWELPTEFPDLAYAKYIGLDVESRDPNLIKRGPGFIRGDAEVVGISLATESGFKIYLPFAHAIGPQLDRKFVIEYVKAQLSRPEQIKVGANLMYELEALDSLGIEIKGQLFDVQIAEPLLDEEKPDGFSLEVLSRDYVGQGKSEAVLQEAADNWSLDKKRDLWRMPPKYSGEYAEDDAYLPILIIQKQLERLDKENLNRVWELETKLLPILWKMRRHGVRVDLERAETLSKEIIIDENRMLADIRDMVGLQVDPWSGKSLEAAFSKLGLSHHLKYTAPTKQYPGGQASFTNDFFKSMAGAHPVCDQLLDYRNTCKMRRDFIEGLVIGYNVNERLHPQWHQLRQDDEDRANGTKTGRVASSKPNLTQIPARHPVWGPRVRSLFIADEGGRWCKHDFSQQEPRITIDFSCMKNFEGAREARQRYIDDPSTDYHQLTADLVSGKTGQVFERRKAKDINLGSAYGMGKWKLAEKLGVTVSEAEEILEAYHRGVPYVKKLEERCTYLAQNQGFIRTILGRKKRFSLWEPADFDKRKGAFPIRDRDEAEARWGRVVRAYAHKSLNAMVQGTAADQTKSAIILLDELGLTPQIQVYDELNQTIYDDKSAWIIKDVMENAIPEFTVPHLADPDVGPSWGEVVELTR